MPLISSFSVMILRSAMVLKKIFDHQNMLNIIAVLDQHDVGLTLQQMDYRQAKFILPDINLKSFTLTPISDLNDLFLIADIASSIEHCKDISLGAGGQAKQLRRQWPSRY